MTGIAVGSFSAVALARFLLRIWPIDGTGLVRKGCARWQRIVALVGIPFALSPIPTLVLSINKEEGWDLQGSLAFDTFGQSSMMILFATGWGTTIILGFGLSRWIHTHPRYFLKRSFILFPEISGKKFQNILDR